jgi:Rap1a immunity proteins
MFRLIAVIIALFASAGFTASPASAEYLLSSDRTGNWLLEVCSNREDNNLFWSCGMYIDGVVDSDTMQVICFPTGVNNGQIRDVVSAYLKEKPDVRHMRAWSIITLALAKAFPCAKNNAAE